MISWARNLRWLLHLAVAAVVLTLILHNFGWQDASNQLRGVRPWWLVAAFLLAFVDGSARVFNWRQLLIGLGRRQPGMFRRLIGCYFSGGFIGTVVPSTAGTDALRAMFAANALGGHLALHTAPLVTMNVMGLAGGCLVGLTGVLLATGHDYPAWYLHISALLFVGVLSVAVAGFYVLQRQRGLLFCVLRRMGRRWFWLRRIARKFVSGLSVFSRPGVRFMPVFGVTVITQLLRASSQILVARSLGMHLPLEAWLILAPLTTISGLLPLSVAGFGGEQAALVYLMSPLGVPAGQALALSLTFATLWLATNIVYGGIAFITMPRQVRQTVAVDTAS